MVKQPDARVFIHNPAELATEYVAWAEKIQAGVGIPFGIKAVDDHMVPMRAGDLVCIIARPGMGKTSVMAYLARQEAQRIINRDASMTEAVVYVTWEQSAEELEVFFQLDGKYSASDLAWGRVDLDVVKKQAVKRASLPIWVIGHGIGRAGQKLPRMTADVVLQAVETMKVDYGITPVLALFDYMQLVPVSSYRDRVQQVSEVPHLIKELALRIGVPAVVGVQAARDVDSRSDKIPEMADAQWACVTGDSRLVNADTGVVYTARKILQSGNIPFPIHALDLETMKLVKANIVAAKENPPEPIFEIQYGPSDFIATNANHRFYTPEGWKTAKELKPGDWIAKARSLEVNPDVNDISTNLAYITGLLLGDGTVTRSLTLTNSDPEVLDSFSAAVNAEWNGTYKVGVRKQTAWNTYDATIVRVDERIFPNGNGALNWAKQVGLFGQTANNKHLPSLKLGNEQVAALLAGLFVTDGCVSFRNDRPQITFATCSVELAEDVCYLLTRLGIGASTNVNIPKRKNRKLPMWCVRVSGTDVVRFNELVKIPGRKGRLLAEFIADHPDVNGRSMGDLIPPKFNLEAVDELKRQHMRSWFNNVKGRSITRGRLETIAQATGSEYLAMLAESDVRWVKVWSVSEEGFEPTYDFCVPGLENFVVNGLVTHNSSIEQTADKIFSLWRPAQTQPPNSVIELEGQRYDVNDRLLIMRILKQRFEQGRRTWALYFEPEYLKLASLETRFQ